MSDSAALSAALAAWRRLPGDDRVLDRDAAQQRYGPDTTALRRAIPAAVQPATAAEVATVVWTLALLYSAAFAAISAPTVLLAVTAVLLAIGLPCFHKPLDLAYTGYLILLGAAVEYTGVLSGQWYYPGDPPGGVPPWFITLWDGVKPARSILDL